MTDEKKPKGQRKGDRHKKVQSMLRLYPVVREQLQKLAERKMTSVSAEITEAIRKHLESYDLWPPS